MGKPIVGIQMYSLRDEAERDLFGTLEKVAEMGYKAVELIGYFNAKAEKLKERAEQAGLRIPSTFISLNFKVIGKLQNDFAKELDYAGVLGVKYIVTPWIPVQEQPTMDDVKFLANVLTKCGQQAKDAGIQFGIHNHDTDFKLVDGKPLFDHLLERVPQELMMAELDLGWIYMAGYRPADYLRKYRGRVPLVHLRDFVKGRKDTELGKGVVGCEELLGELAPAEVECVFVEQEHFLESSLLSAKANMEYLRKIGYVN
ncbi:sugar phosphate isomerase/epimerase [Paenibacillus sp. GSMTC-2017]|uniref:sugar phosphate isomerase/epimerase family protein n=1 Tax=Paenibacillus sp. GSMTC-2017 TaxID=2794350 RepID=UPI0018D951EA|nr:sugar phosphate isomerase/epimerase [Paenibacillus sp. GSMTC-2017]MBH5320886.1 sugar phosphate isomerase/epimerase [Paenibacillus sp. GSMTC-2017]